MGGVTRRRRGDCVKPSPGYLPTLLREQGVLERLRRPGGAAYRLAKLIVEGQDAEEHLSEERLGFTADDVEDISAVRGTGRGRHARAQRRSHARSGHDRSGGPHRRAEPRGSRGHRSAVGVPRSTSCGCFDSDCMRSTSSCCSCSRTSPSRGGLQADLVDALTTPGKRPGARSCAPCASSWRSPRRIGRRHRKPSRAGRADGTPEMFSLDVHKEEAEVQATSLIGRYLNAARIGQRVLKERTTEELLAGVENACTDCMFRPRCHPVFGTTADGHGLFPLTAKAAVTLGRLADRALRPRAVLTEVVSDVVASAEDVTAGRFPQSAAWRRAADEAVSARRLDEAPFAVVVAPRCRLRHRGTGARPTRASGLARARRAGRPAAAGTRARADRRRRGGRTCAEVPRRIARPVGVRRPRQARPPSLDRRPTSSGCRNSSGGAAARSS